MTPAEAKAKVDSDDWKAEWDHPQIMQELLSEPPAPASIDHLPYEFNREDTTIPMVFSENSMAYKLRQT